MSENRRRFTGRPEMIEEALMQWQAEPNKEKYAAGLEEMLEKSREEGWGFKLTVFAEVLDTPGDPFVAMTKGDARRFAEVNEDLITIKIPSKDTEKKEKNAGANIFVSELRADPTLIFETKKDGAVGFFRPHEIDSLELE